MRLVATGVGMGSSAQQTSASPLDIDPDNAYL